MKPVHTILTEARDLIADPAHWTKGVQARTSRHGPKIHPNHPNAQCWCSYGAIMKVSRSFRERFAAGDALANFMGGDVAMFNDNRSHAAVIAAFNKAIEANK